jgi:hypothetical protein
LTTLGGEVIKVPVSMKKIIRFSIILASLLASRVAQGQETVYLSNLGQTPSGSNLVGSDSWVASEIITGNNPSGYLLDYAQLEMTDASGNPSGFIAMLYSAVALTGINPGSSLGTLTGSSNPSTAGIYTYIPTSSLTLSPNTDYFIVLTAGRAVANGAYEWSFLNTLSYNPSGGWGAGGVWKSSNGSTWLYNSGGSQFAIAATAIPEPSSAFLLLLGSGVLMYVRRIFHRQSA